MGDTENKDPKVPAKDDDEGKQTPPANEPGNEAPKVNAHGFPDDTPLAEMSVDQREAYWKHKARKHENTVKALPKDLEAIKSDAEKWRQSQLTPDQAKDEELRNSIREEVRKDLLKQNAPKLVSAEFKTLVGDAIPAKTLKAFLDDMDHTKYITDDGEVDTERVKNRVKDLVPEEPAPSNRRQSRTHQGVRKNEGATGISAGRALYNEMHGIKN